MAEFFTVGDLARRWCMSPYQLRQWLRDGKLTHVKLSGSKYLIPSRDALEFEKQHLCEQVASA